MDQQVQIGVSVVIVTYQTGDVLFDCIQSVLAAPDVDELVLVNHGNPPETVARLEALAAREAKLCLVDTHANLGFARGCNIGVRASRGAHLLFLNPDAILRPGDAARLVETAQGRAEPYIIGARILDMDGAEQRGGRRGALTPISALAGFVGLGGAFHREREPLPEAAVPMPTVSGAAMLMSRAGFDQLGGFDEGYFLHVEDIDICKRARDAGGEVVFEPRVAVAHVGSTSQISALRVEVFKALGLSRYVAQHGGPLGALWGMLLTPVFLGGALARTLVWRVRGVAQKSAAPAE